MRLIARALFLAIACVSSSGVLWQQPARAQKNDTKLDVRHVESKGSYLRVKIPADTQADDRLVLVYVDPKSGKAAADVILVPEGKVDEGVRQSLKTWTAFGLKEGEVHQPGTTFNNGSFDLVATVNSHKKVGVYAFAWVSLKKSEAPIGTSTTYFSLSSWATDKAGEVEVPLPNKANESREEYIPRTCDVSVWVITKDGKKRAQGAVKIKRD